jgi:hypothetical protein
VTKALQEVHLDKNIKLLDSPGVVFADAEDAAAAALRNAVKIERLEDPGEWVRRGCVPDLPREGIQVYDMWCGLPAKLRGLHCLLPCFRGGVA